jgi:predicted acylesterase/phospholipase RssA
MSFAVGEALVSEGVAPDAVYIIEAGTADVLLTEPNGRLRWIGQLASGATCGEMSFLTGEVAAATVRARSEVDALAIAHADLADLVGSNPMILSRLGTMLARRLAAANARGAEPEPARLIVLEDAGAPVLAAAALAASVAWHTRHSTVLVCTDPRRAEELGQTLGVGTPSGTQHPVQLGPLLSLAAAPAGDGPERLLAELSRTARHVLVLTAEVTAADHRVRMAPPGAAQPAPPTVDVRVVRAWEHSARLPGLETSAPPPTTTDAEALRSGLLPLRTPLGRSIGRVARELVGLRVGVALGAGSSKGFAHIGVLRALEEAGVPIDRIAGSSIGAVVAGMHAAGFDPAATEEALARVGSATFRPVFPRASLMSHEGVARMMRATWGAHTMIENLAVPLGVVAADMLSGDEVVFRRGLLWAAALASITIPGVYPPQRMGGRLLVDGGVVDAVPTEVVRDMGADVVVAVRLAERSRPGRVHAEATRPAGRAPSVVQTIMRCREIQGGVAFDPAGVVAIEPRFPPDTGLGLRDFTRGQRFVEVGERTARAALPALSAVLPWLG